MGLGRILTALLVIWSKNLLKLELKPQIKSICEGQLAILRHEHFNVTVNWSLLKAWTNQHLFIGLVAMLTGHFWKSEPANISSLASDRQTQLRRDVLRGLGVDDQVFRISQNEKSKSWLTEFICVSKNSMADWIGLTWKHEIMRYMRTMKRTKSVVVLSKMIWVVRYSANNQKLESWWDNW
jgi:hypothetical protein